MIKIWIDDTLIYIISPEKLPAFLDELNFSYALLPRKFWEIVHTVMAKKGFVVSSVKMVEGEAYDEWTEG